MSGNSTLTLLGIGLIVAALGLSVYSWFEKSGGVDRVSDALWSQASPATAPAPEAESASDSDSDPGREPEREAASRPGPPAAAVPSAVSESEPAVTTRPQPAAATVPTPRATAEARAEARPAPHPRPRPPRPKHRSAAHAARAGDAEALLEFIAQGEDVNDINSANLMGTISGGHVAALRVLFDHGYEHHRYAGFTLGDYGVKYNQPEVIRLVQEVGGPFSAPPAYIALVLSDEDALEAALAAGDGDTQFIGRNLDWWADEVEQQELLEEARDRLLSRGR